MARTVNSVTIAGAIEPVFDLVTQARFWRQWHPATLAVAGVTERPYRPGDVIHERAKIGPRVHEGAWRVVEHVRPSRIVLRIEKPPVQITYALKAVGGATEFQRTLEYDAPDFLPAGATAADLDTIMHAQSEEGLKKLKDLVEQILRKETAGLE